MGYVEDVGRVGTGIEALDAALQGGVPKGSWVAITGEPGTGKSILCMHYAWEGLRVGDPVIYVTTEAEFRDIVRQARQFRMYFDDYEMHYLGGKPSTRRPQLVVIDIFSLLKTAKQLGADLEDVERSRRYAALEIEVLIAAIREAYNVLGLLQGGRKSPIKHTRLIIDSMSAFWADRPAMARRFSYQLKIATHRENVTAFLVSQYAMTTKSVDYDEPVAVLREGRTEVIRIGEFVDEFFDDGSEGVELLKEPIYTLSMNLQNIRVEWRRIKAVSRHREKRKLLRIRLENGRAISVTPDHSLYALKGYKIVPVKGSEIRVGDLIPALTEASLSPSKGSEGFVLLREAWSREMRYGNEGNLSDRLDADEGFREATRRKYGIEHNSRYYLGLGRKMAAPTHVLKQNISWGVVYETLNEELVATEPQEEVSGSYETLRERFRSPRNYAYGDVGFLKVKQIEPVDPSSNYVYDLSVEDNENFFAGAGWVLAHNSTFGYGLEHIADGVIHLWMDNVEVAKEVRRFLIIKKMRMTNHYEGAFKVTITPGEGIHIKPISGAAAGI